MECTTYWLQGKYIWKLNKKLIPIVMDTDLTIFLEWYLRLYSRKSLNFAAIVSSEFSPVQLCGYLATIQRAGESLALWALSTDFLVPDVWKGAWEFASVASSQVILMLPVQGPGFEKRVVNQCFTECQQQMWTLHGWSVTRWAQKLKGNSGSLL